jgi:hypothetical protein
VNSVVRRKKNTLFGKVIRKIESELAPREEKLISPNVPLDSTSINDDTVAIQLKREEMKAAKHNKSDEVIVFEN